MRRQMELSNEVAAELAGSQDLVLRTLEQHLDCDVFRRGKVTTREGEGGGVQPAATVVRELSSMVDRGHDIGPATIESVARVLDERESPSKVLEDVVWRHRNLRVTPKSVNQKRYVDAIRRSTVTFGVGPAGTGKTFLAIAMATAALSRREVNRIILTRPAVEAGERLGFLPGDLMAKVDPYLRPLFDALHDMMDPERVSANLEKGVIEVAPLAFMRGRTLNDSFVILDEAQNTTPEQMKMFLTRLGFGSKMVVTGDITQVDLPRDQKSGLIVVNDILGGVDGLEFVNFAGEFVSGERIAELNGAHRGKVWPTDVLSFPVDESGAPLGPRELGDVVICPEHTEDLLEAVVHGVLHLTGMDHETDDGEMLVVQAEIMGWIR